MKLKRDGKEYLPEGWSERCDGSPKSGGGIENNYFGLATKPNRYLFFKPFNMYGEKDGSVVEKQRLS